MLKQNVKIELSNGTIVYAYECWDYCSGIVECGVCTDITDEKGNIIGSVHVTIPDKEDYLMDDPDEAVAYEKKMAEFIKMIEDEINC